MIGGEANYIFADRLCYLTYPLEEFTVGASLRGVVWTDSNTHQRSCVWMWLLGVGGARGFRTTLESINCYGCVKKKVTYYVLGI